MKLTQLRQLRFLRSFRTSLRSGSRRLTKCLASSLVLTGLALSHAGVSTAQQVPTVPTLIQTDGSVGIGMPKTTIQGVGGIHEITEAHGFLDGHSTLLHSFEFFDVGLGDTARFTAQSTGINSVVSRVTGNDGSKIHGSIESKIPGADFYFLNPNGVFFGQNSSIDVPKAFHLSADPSGLFANQMQVVLPSSSALSGPVLSMASSEAFGFGSSGFGDITLDGATLLFDDPATRGGGSVTLRGGNISLENGAKILAINRNVKVEATGRIELSGVNEVDGFGAGIDVANFSGDAAPEKAIELIGSEVVLDENAYLLTESVGIECESCATGQIEINSDQRFSLAAGGGNATEQDIFQLRFPGINIPRTAVPGAARVVTYRTSESPSVGAITLTAREFQIPDDQQIATLERGPAGEPPRSGGSIDTIVVMDPPESSPVNLIPRPPGLSAPVLALTNPGDSALPAKLSTPVLELTNPGDSALPAVSSSPPKGSQPTSKSTSSSASKAPTPTVSEIGGEETAEASSGESPSTDDSPVSSEGSETSESDDSSGESSEEGAETESQEASEEDEARDERMMPYMGVSSRFAAALDKCSDRADGNDATNILSTYRWPGLPLSPEGPLLAYSILGTESADSSSNAEGDRSETEAASILATATAALRNGQIGWALSEFERAEQIASASGDTDSRIDALLGRAEAQQSDGRYEESTVVLEEALELARTRQDPIREAALLGALGNARIAMGESSAAASILQTAVHLTRGMTIAVVEPVETPRESAEDSSTFRLPEGLSSVLLNNLGNQRMVAGEPGKALTAYLESYRIAAEAEDWLHAARTRANAASAAFRLDDIDQAIDSLGLAREALLKAETTPAEETVIRIHLAQTGSFIAATRSPERSLAMLSAYEDLLAAIESAKNQGDLRSASHGLGSLGALYAQDYGRIREAFFMTRQAILISEQAQAPDLTARWKAQLGGLHVSAGDLPSAISAYRTAVSLLELTRPEASPVYGSAEVAFRAAVEPIYRKLTELLIEASQSESDESQRQARYSEARNVIEQWKTAELRSYFNDGCAADAQMVDLENLDPSAAIVYPIPFEDRLELLVSRNVGIEHFSVPIGEELLDAEVSRFRVHLGNRVSDRYETSARQLYDWLVGPYRSTLEEWGIDTLVFVPTGSLRTIPLSALRDDEGFLVQSFAVATTVSLNLLDPRSLDQGQPEVLLAGISESVQGFSELPSVPAELAAIREIFDGEVLLDRDFGVESLKEAVIGSGRGIVHIASHAEFTGDPETSFILTYDERMSTESLAALIQEMNSNGSELELLVLSACETAAGNERAALGLAGAAIRSGARSVIGSLWSVSDEATSELFVKFYKTLRAGQQNKAEALRTAQLQLIDSKNFTHPFYWAPFLILNNWL
ncbi:MAG TPA: CHAT domain-containing protein [Myxococcales bacterium]|nr:CHAT domain-containing protein [Myxococcales bacterium]